MKKIIITGVTGQDGSHMADYLLENTNDAIIAGVRRLSVRNHENIKHLTRNDRFKLVDLDVTDSENTSNLIEKEKPDFFINFAANSFVGNSWDMPVNHMETNAMAVLYQLTSIAKHCPKCRYYNAGSSEEFGDVISSPQDENHPLRPRSPYGASKASARHIVKVYRDSFNLFAVQGWLFNHEGTRRGIDFVTRKISNGIAKLKKALEIDEVLKFSHPKPKLPVLELGNMSAKRDWSDAEDFVEGVWLMLNNTKPKNYVLASGETHSIRDFVKECLNQANIKYLNSGEGEEEKFTTEDERIIVKVNKEFYRPAEVSTLTGNPTLAEKELGWKRKTDFNSLVKKMYKNDLNLLDK